MIAVFQEDFPLIVIITKALLNVNCFNKFYVHLT